jgi:hypothetical protein
MHWLLIGGALVLVIISVCTAFVHLTIDLLRVVDEQFQSPPLNEECCNQLPGGSATKRG